MKTRFTLSPLLLSLAAQPVIGHAAIDPRPVAAIAASAAGDDIAPCPAPAGALVTRTLAKAPLAIRKAIKKNLGVIVDPGVDFDATDVVQTGTNRRLIFMWHRGSRWLVATERGGEGYNDPILTFRLPSGASKATSGPTKVAFPDTVCAEATKLWQP